MISLGKDCELNLKRLIATRLLINANSGAGKSWAIRRLLEQSHGEVQQILIDLEGEFSTLREKFDYLLVGKDGEISANIRTAEILAKKLLELNVSTIIDLSELRHTERITFVKRFLDSMINSPKELWHPCLVVVDEAHIFCPESGKSESASAVIDLATRGRKRGFCAILATQRISKLSKDAVAELNNYMVGRTGLDIDMKRASEILGFTTKEDTRSLRDLNAGDFICFGSAFEHNGLQRTRVGDIKTTHPDRTRGVQIKKASKTPENIKKLLKNVIDLPKEAERELKTTEDMKKEIKELRTKLTLSGKMKPKTKIDEKVLERAKVEGKKEAERLYDKEYKNISKQYDTMSKSLILVEKKIENIIEEAKKLIPITQNIGLHIVKPEFPDIREKTMQRPISRFEPSPKPAIINRESFEDNSQKPLDRCARMIYSFLYANQQRGFSKIQIGVMVGYSPNSGGFNNALSRLKSLNLVIKNGESIVIGQIDESIIDDSEEFSIELIRRKLDKCSKEILDVLLENEDSEFSKEDLANMTKSQYSFNSGGFNNSFSRLNALGFIEKNNTLIRLSEEIKELL